MNNSGLIAALYEQIGFLHKMRRHLAYSHQRIRAWWQADVDFDALDEASLESLAAFKARFAELQDHLASTMKLVAQIEGEDTRQFTYVLNYMTQLEILDSMEQWLVVRDLRNQATHDYSKASADKTKHFDSLLQQVAYLFTCMDSLLGVVAKSYPLKNKEI